MPKYRKKPVVIEAVQFTGEDNFPEIVSFFGEKFGSDFYYNPQKDGYFIKTLEGDMKVSLGDYIIKGVDGEFYPCKPDIFAKTYEEVTDNAE